MYRRCWSLFCTIKNDMWSSSFFCRLIWFILLFLLHVDLTLSFMSSCCWFLSVILFFLILDLGRVLLSSSEYWLDVIFCVSTRRLKSDYDPLLSSFFIHWCYIKRCNVIVNWPTQSVIQSCKITCSLSCLLLDRSVYCLSKANIVAIKVNWT